jgi:ketosteroid isomerase-like protein
MADDIRWTLMGTTRWSRTYLGKQALLEEMFGPVYALLEAPPITTAHRILADEDHVVVEFRGQAMTRAGKPYNNTYCMVLRLADGKISEVTEYCDTALIDAVM